MNIDSPCLSCSKCMVRTQGKPSTKGPYCSRYIQLPESLEAYDKNKHFYGIKDFLKRKYTRDEWSILRGVPTRGKFLGPRRRDPKTLKTFKKKKIPMFPPIYHRHRKEELNVPMIYMTSIPCRIVTASVCGINGHFKTFEPPLPEAYRHRTLPKLVINKIDLADSETRNMWRRLRRKLRENERR